MAYELIFSRSAERDLEEIARFIEVDNPTAAGRFVREIRRRLEHLMDFPATGRARDDLRPNIRISAFDRRVTVFYRVAKDRVRIVRIHYRGRNLLPSGTRDLSS